MTFGVEDRIIEAGDGWPLAATLFRPDDARMAVLVSAGTGFPRGFYGRFARWMAERGAVVLTYDYRGIGGSRPTIWRRCRWITPTGGGWTCPPRCRR